MSLLRSLFLTGKARIPVALSLTLLGFSCLPSAFAVRIDIPDDGEASRPINQPLPTSSPVMGVNFPITPSFTGVYPANAPWPQPSSTASQPVNSHDTPSPSIYGETGLSSPPSHSVSGPSNPLPQSDGLPQSGNVGMSSDNQTSRNANSPYSLPSYLPSNALPPRSDGYDTLPSLPPSSDAQSASTTKVSPSALRHMKPSSPRVPMIWGQPKSPTTELPPFPGGDTPEATLDNAQAKTSPSPDSSAGTGRRARGMGAMAGSGDDPPVIVPKDGTPVTLSAPPSLNRDLIPVENQSGAASPLSLENPANTQDYMRYAPYNTFSREIDLWNLEGKRFVRSLVVVSPDKSQFAYTEVLFLPYNRQTVSRLYLVNTPPLPLQPLEHLPSEDALRPIPPVEYSAYAARFNPAKTVQFRKALLEVGYTRVKPFDFKTLTVVDWSNTGKRLLLKEKSGTLHVGLRTSDILVYDQAHGTVTIYPEVRRVIEHYWKTKGNMPDLQQMSWEVYPLGWELGSDSAVLLKAWALDTKEKKFLGVWRYDVEAERTELLSLEDTPVMAAANGLLATPIPPPPVKKPLWKRTIQQITPEEDDFDAGPVKDLDVDSAHRIDRDE